MTIDRKGRGLHADFHHPGIGCVGLFEFQQSTARPNVNDLQAVSRPAESLHGKLLGKDLQNGIRHLHEIL
jgi:hypothetical protein